MLHAEVVRFADRARPVALRARPSRRPCWRLQRRPHRWRHLQPAVVGARRVVATRESARYERLLAQGWVDAVRARHPNDRYQERPAAVRPAAPRKRRRVARRWSNSRYRSRYPGRRCDWPSPCSRRCAAAR